MAPHGADRKHRSRSLMGRRWPSEAFCHLVQHHLRSTPTDRLYAGVASHALNRALAHVAHAAMKLQAVVEDLVDERAGQGLEHRHLPHHVLALRVAPGRVEEQGARRLHLAEPRGEPLSYDLLVPQRCPERLALLDPAEGEL